MKAYRVSFNENGQKWYLSFDGIDTQEVLKAELFGTREGAEQVVREDAKNTNSDVSTYSIEEITIID